MQDRTERIGQRAHEIWERKGRPDGLEHEHWQMALAETEAEEAQGGTGVPAGPAKKPRHSKDAPSLEKEQLAATEPAMSRVAEPSELRKDRPLSAAGRRDRQDR